MRQRLVGGSILVLLLVMAAALAVLTLGGRDPGLGKTNIPPPPQGLETRVLPLEQRAAEAEAALQRAQITAASPTEAPTGVPDHGVSPPPPPVAVTNPSVSSAAPAPPHDNVAPLHKTPVTSAAVPLAPVPTAQAWVVQLGSFSSTAHAIALRDKLRGLGHAAFIEHTSGSNGPVYRVRVGPELSRVRADELKAQIEREANQPAMVLGYP